SFVRLLGGPYTTTASHLRRSRERFRRSRDREDSGGIEQALQCHGAPGSDARGWSWPLRPTSRGEPLRATNGACSRRSDLFAIANHFLARSTSADPRRRHGGVL